MADRSTGDPVTRPQPLGTFPLPAGYLLVPGGEGTEEVRRALLAGRLPAAWPPELRFYGRALVGDRDGAVAALTGDDPVSRYNRLVLDPDGADADPAVLRTELGELGPLVDVVAFVLGRTDTPPEVGDTTGELRALVLSARAAHELAAGDAVLAVALLDEAAAVAGPVAPPLAGLMLGAAGSTASEHGLPGVADRFRRALALLDGAEGLRVGRAELHLALAGELHVAARDDPARLAEAVPHYHAALQLVSAARAPELWAAAHADLAAAYLTMPMVQASDQLRLGVAVSSLRSALTVYTPEAHPRRWASAQLNLANSLVYAPSHHREDNLREAVGLYEAVLAVRGRAEDPLGRARVLANQGNALAHLGMFDDAKARLFEARFLFEEMADGESVRAVRGVLDEVARQQVLVRGGTG